jgi:hypothetical protein
MGEAVKTTQKTETTARFFWVHITTNYHLGQDK